MKIKDIIKILEITEGKTNTVSSFKKLPKDMYDEFDCTIHGVTKPLEELDFIHLVRSYKNKIRDLTDGYVSRDANSKMVFKLEEEVSNAMTTHFNFGSGYFGTTAVASANADGNGHGAFEYAVPSGFYALNSKNLKEFG